MVGLNMDEKRGGQEHARTWRSLNFQVGGTPLFESNILISGKETEAPGKRGASVR